MSLSDGAAWEKDHPLVKKIEVRDGNQQAEATTYPSRWHFIAERTANLVKEKNAAYGDSFDKCEHVFKLLYPNGVKAEQLQDMLTLVRIWDKMMRIATNKAAFGENPFQDILGYALLALEKAERGETK